MKKIVGLPAARIFRTGAAHRDFVNCAYSRAVSAAGALPVLIPIGDPADAAAYLERVDGLLIPGGIDVEPHQYGQAPHPKLGEVDPGQDGFELAIIREAWRREMPIFAICRGIQSLNVALGGSLIQDLPSQAPSSLRHKQSAPRPQATHDIDVTEGSALFRLTGPRVAVNSFHHQAIERVAPELHVVARSTDGVIEAVESRTHPRLIAVQCHPEEMAVCDPIARSLFEQFVRWL